MKCKIIKEQEERMSRTIKFRAWGTRRKPQDKQEMFYPKKLFLEEFLKMIRVVCYGWKLMQFTGLKDKNRDTFIYEGDFIDIDGNIGGNIYENQEDLQALLKKGVDCLVISMETKTWGSTIKEAIRRGCQFTE